MSKMENRILDNIFQILYTSPEIESKSNTCTYFQYKSEKTNKYYI